MKAGRRGARAFISIIRTICHPEVPGTLRSICSLRATNCIPFFTLSINLLHITNTPHYPPNMHPSSSNVHTPPNPHLAHLLPSIRHLIEQYQSLTYLWKTLVEVNKSPSLLGTSWNLWIPRLHSSLWLWMQTLPALMKQTSSSCHDRKGTQRKSFYFRGPKR